MWWIYEGAGDIGKLVGKTWGLQMVSWLDNAFVDFVIPYFCALVAY